MSHSRLSDFRVGHRGALDAVFSDVVASLLHKGLVSLDVVAQDGMRVRAPASAPSFRRIPVPARSRTAGPHGDHDPAIEAWRSRMESAEAKQTYRQRAGLCELTNAHLRNLGMERFLVRGIGKVTCVALMSALALNLIAHATALLS